MGDLGRQLVEAWRSTEEECLYEACLRGAAEQRNRISALNTRLAQLQTQRTPSPRRVAGYHADAAVGPWEVTVSRDRVGRGSAATATPPSSSAPPKTPPTRTRPALYSYTPDYMRCDLCEEETARAPRTPEPVHFRPSADLMPGRWSPGARGRAGLAPPPPRPRERAAVGGEEAEAMHRSIVEEDRRERMYVSVPAVPSVSGVYYRLPEKDRRKPGLPMYASDPYPAAGFNRTDRRVLYSTPCGTWMLSDVARAMATGRGAVQSRKHRHRPPTAPDLDWRRYDPSVEKWVPVGPVRITPSLPDYPSAVTLRRADRPDDTWTFVARPGAQRGLPVWTLGDAKLYAEADGCWLLDGAERVSTHLAALKSTPHCCRSPADPALTWSEWGMQRRWGTDTWVVASGVSWTAGWPSPCRADASHTRGAAGSGSPVETQRSVTFADEPPRDTSSTGADRPVLYGDYIFPNSPQGSPEVGPARAQGAPPLLAPAVVLCEYESTLTLKAVERPSEGPLRGAGTPASPQQTRAARHSEEFRAEARPGGASASIRSSSKARPQEGAGPGVAACADKAGRREEDAEGMVRSKEKKGRPNDPPCKGREVEERSSRSHSLTGGRRGDGKGSEGTARISGDRRRTGTQGTTTGESGRRTEVSTCITHSVVRTRKDVEKKARQRSGSTSPTPTPPEKPMAPRRRTAAAPLLEPSVGERTKPKKEKEKEKEKDKAAVAPQ
eukprot:TRINITY_DN10361_c0_g2_i1.p1 TRINITY_DN10361_c0_g2~~TRINITY_DN10361_c0_g2_i1.p1  ORF type:complete len:723 (+),score=80.01 TRINITY_DN10361_c0_g2_i1:192-2360(+)